MSVRSAATVLLVREAPKLEVLMVRRNLAVDFMAGAMVFPGGKVDEGDHDADWAELVTGWDNVAPDERPRRIAAIREAFEESGILLGHEGPLTDNPEEARKATETGELRFIDYVRDSAARPDIEALTPFSRWLTPSWAPKRFDTFFYIAEAAADQVATHDGHETVALEWISPSRALELSNKGERQIVFPTRVNLKVLAQSASLAHARGVANARAMPTIEPRVVMLNGVRHLQVDDHWGLGPISEPQKLIESGKSTRRTDAAQ